MAINYVQVIAPESGNRGIPDLGNILVLGAAKILPQDFNGLFWWRAQVDASNADLKAWRDSAVQNVGWLAFDLPDATDAARIWNKLWNQLQLDKPAGSDFWAVAAERMDQDGEFSLGPDLGATLNPLTTAFEKMIDFSQYKDRFVLWCFDSTATNQQLNTWVTANPGLGWKTGNPPSNTTLFVNKIAVAANNTQRFARVETAP